MNDSRCVEFLQWALPKLNMRWAGFRKVRKQVWKRILRRLKELGLEGEAAYRDFLRENPSEWPVLDSFCRISISRFYRDRGVFDYLRSEILPTLATAATKGGRDELHCWSAGCASGEEPYTLAMIWKLDVGQQFPGVTFRIAATDSDRHMLARARQARYSMSSLKDLPSGWLAAAFTEAGGLHQLKPEFREGTDFLQQDIRSGMPARAYDLVLCRHLAFTYFDEALQKEVLQRILGRLAPDGFLITGKQERMAVGRDDLEECRPRMGVYRKTLIA